MVAHFEASTDKNMAIQIERFIKKQKSTKFIEMLCDEKTQLSGILAQLVRVPNIRD